MGHFQMECDKWRMAPSNPNHWNMHEIFVAGHQPTSHQSIDQNINSSDCFPTEPLPEITGHVQVD